MKIALDLRPLEIGDWYRGIGYYIYHLVPQLLALDQKNHYFLLAYSQKNPLYSPNLCTPGVHRNWIFCPKPQVPPRVFWWFDQTGILKQIKKIQPDISHFMANNPPLIKYSKTVLTIHDMIPYIFASDYQKPFDKKWELVLKKRLMRKADFIITDSGHSKKDISRILNYPSQKIQPIHLAVDQTFRPAPKTQNYLLYLGDLYGNDPRKKVDWLVRVFAQLVSEKKYQQLKLVLAGKKGGENNDYEKIIRLAKELGIAKKLILPGFVDYQKLPRLIAQARAFIYPSIYEGFGLPPLQALASAVPVVAFNLTSMPEVVGQAAILVSPDEQDLLAGIKKALDPKVAQKFKKQGLKQARKFSWEKCARQTLEVYERAAKL